eukprot:CAMPEP_0113907192 /NCGR_PEP_ID=MMETSP0780_2-20120614/25308_1 /TAXON_ID=652834 /ORGANISM="Palpitomonas bilix" /LENGTH=237 /DNA_ID=CAMNT_0000902159 /DNA_START=128 /DNA_END=841 /DNA_ORIENTATION=- /assembly_acc=CAM_ASM_000599
MASTGLLQAQFSDAHEKYVILAQNASGANVARVVQQAVDDALVFFYAELMAVPNVAELGSSETHRGVYKLVEVFSRGTIKDYRAHDGMPSLSDTALRKLKMLSLCTLVRGKATMSYDHLMENLECSSKKDLEELVVESMYKGLFVGKMDQATSTLEVHQAVGRDVSASDLDDMERLLRRWLENASGVVSSVGDSLSAVEESAKKANARKVEVEEAKNSMKDTIKGGEASADMETTYM